MIKVPTKILIAIKSIVKTVNFDTLFDEFCRFYNNIFPNHVNYIFFHSSDRSSSFTVKYTVIDEIAHG